MRSSAVVSAAGEPGPAIGQGVSETGVLGMGGFRALVGGGGWRNPSAIAAAVRAATDGERIDEIEIQR